METARSDGGEGCLDIDNPEHMWALHYIYLPRLNKDLELFRGQWNQHSLSTEGNLSPLQLFVKNSLAHCNTTLTAMQDLFNGRNLSGEALVNGPLPELPDLSQVVVPAIPCPISLQRLEVLQQQIDPLQDDGALGINLYTSTLRFIQLG